MEEEIIGQQLAAGGMYGAASAAAQEMPYTKMEMMGSLMNPDYLNVVHKKDLVLGNLNQLERDIILLTISVVELGKKIEKSTKCKMHLHEIIQQEAQAMIETSRAKDGMTFKGLTTSTFKATSDDKESKVNKLFNFGRGD